MKKPKRTVRMNIWGNLVGYEGGKRVKEFGGSNPMASDQRVQDWLLGIESN
jgi:hypothetical protein